MWRSRLEEDRGGRMRRRMEAEVDRGGTEGMKCRKMEVEEHGKWRRRRMIFVKMQISILITRHFQTHSSHNSFSIHHP